MKEFFTKINNLINKLFPKTVDPLDEMLREKGVDPDTILEQNRLRKNGSLDLLKEEEDLDLDLDE